MARAPVHRLRKSDIVWLAKNKCKHSVSYLEHYNCFLQEHPDGSPLEEKIGFLDIETTGLNASWGFVMTYCIKELDGPIIENSITPMDLKKFRFDERLMADLVKDMKKFDRFVVYWGKNGRFDIPFVRTRAIKHGVHFPEYGEHYITDLYDIVKNKLRFDRRSLAVACDRFGLGCKDKPLHPDVHLHAAYGDKDALEYVLAHNRDDVVLTEALWKKIKNYAFQANVSI